MVNFGVRSVKMRKKPSKLMIRKKIGNPIITFIINTELGSSGGGNQMARSGGITFPKVKKSSPIATPTATC